MATKKKSTKEVAAPKEETKSTPDKTRVVIKKTARGYIKGNVETVDAKGLNNLKSKNLI